MTINPFSLLTLLSSFSALYNLVYKLAMKTKFINLFYRFILSESYLKAKLYICINAKYKHIQSVQVSVIESYRKLSRNVNPAL